MNLSSFNRAPGRITQGAPRSPVLSPVEVVSEKEGLLRSFRFTNRASATNYSELERAPEAVTPLNVPLSKLMNSAGPKKTSCLDNSGVPAASGSYL